MSLITDFCTYCSCYEIPRNYAGWSAIGLMAAAVNRRVYIYQGDIVHHANMYICLVGEQGIKKSTTKDFAQQFFTEVYPNIPIAASVQSREDIIKFMASTEGIRSFTNADGAAEEYHPYMLFINELENFLSFNIPGMLSFLVDIYDRKYFDCSTIKRGMEKFPNPCVNILACVTPKWLIDKLRGNVITGGICRRMVFVYEIETPTNIISIPRPVITPEARSAEERVRAHLNTIREVTGEFKLTKQAAIFFDDWYNQTKRTLPDDPLMRGYKRSKDVQLLKTCMLLHLAKPGCVGQPLLITEGLLQEGLVALDAIEVNMPKLSIAAGRNELAVPQADILEYVKNKGGFYPEKWIERDCDKDLTPTELFYVLRHLKSSEQLFVVNVPYGDGGVNRVCLATKEKFVELQKMSSGSLDKII